VKRESLPVLGLVLAALCMITVASAPGEFLMQSIFALLCLISFIVPARIGLSRRASLVLDLILIIPFAALVLINENQRILMIALRLFKNGGAYFSILTVIMAYKKREKDDPFTLLMYSMIILMCGGFVAPAYYPYLLLPITFLLIVYCLQNEHFSRRPEGINFSYWFNLAVITGALLLSCLGLYKFFMWSETEVSNLMALISPPLSFSNAFAERANLETMDRLKGSKRVVLRVKAHRSPCYLSGKVFVRYVNKNNNSSWETSRKFKLLSGLPETLAAHVKSHFPGDRGSVFHFARKGEDTEEFASAEKDLALPLDYISVFITSTTTETLFVPRDVLFAMIVGDTLRLDTEGIPVSTTGNIMSGEYHLVLSRDPVIEEVAGLSPYLEVPGIFSPDVALLNQSLVKDCDSDIKKAEKIQEFFHDSFKYGVGPKNPGNHDIIEDFLLTTRQGHCEFFATAMALLLRMNNIPSRYVNGFLVQEYNSLGGYYIVRERDAHAWVEAYFPGRGWVTFDPTPSQSAELARAGLVPPFLQNFYDMIMLKIHSFKSRIAIGDILGAILFIVNQFKLLILWIFSSFTRALIFIICILATFMIITRKNQLIAFFRLKYSRKRDELELSDDHKKLFELLVNFEKILASKKLRRPPTLTPLEFSRSMEEMPLCLEKKASIQDFYRAYCILRYSRSSVTEIELEELREHLFRARKILARKFPPC
jgi:protein-glutamine gamma-glutamyltransferase